MRTTIRKSTFETNSSSVHALVLVSWELLDEWNSRPTDWLDFDELLRCSRMPEMLGGETDDATLEPSSLHLVSEEEMWKRRKERWNGEWIDDDDVIADIHLLPLDALSDPRSWQGEQSSTYRLTVEETDEGLLVDMGLAG